MASNKKLNQPALFVGRFQKIELLGVGLVGEVYRARDTQDASDIDGGVALKILRIGQDASLIKNEALILGQLWHEEEILKDGIHSIPRLITADDLNQQPFLAMEFVRGKQVSQVLRESESGYLEEAVALNIGVQLFRLLHILHEKINKTYSDLKIENLWWLPADERLKITDWNVLQDRKTPSPGKTDPLLQDLFRASVSLYWMLTGELPDFQNELNAERLQHASNWGQISDGVKDLLNKLLREESLKKIGTAHRIKAELDRLLRYWKDDVKALKDRAKGESDDRLDAFSILTHRISQPDQEFLQIEREIQESLKQRNDLTRSVALFGAGSYGAAKNLTDEALPHASEPHIFLWWKQVIDLAEKIESLMKKSGRGDKVNYVRDVALKSINAYQTPDFQSAERFFGEIENFVGDDENIHKAYSELLAVLKVQNLYVSGQEKREEIRFADEKEYKSIYAEAGKYYHEAFFNAEKIVTASLLPDFLSLVYLKNKEEVVKNEFKVAGVVTNANKAFNDNEIDSSFKLWRDGFKLDVDHPKIVDSIVSAANKILDMGKLGLAENLYQIIPSIVSNYSPACNELKRRIQSERLTERLKQESSNSEKVAAMASAPEIGVSYVNIPKETIENEKLLEILIDSANSFFEKGETASALNLWGECFKLDIDYPKLVDSVVSASKKSLEAGDVNLAESVFQIIPAVVSNYSLECDSLRKDIQISRKTLIDQRSPKRKKIEGTLREIKLELKDVKTFNKFIIDDELPNTRKDILKPRKTKEKQEIAPVLTHSKTSEVALRKESSKPARNQVVTPNRSLGNTIGINVNEDTYRKASKQIMDIVNGINILVYDNILTIYILNEKVEALRKCLQNIDPKRGINHFKREWESLDDFENKLSQANDLLKKAVDSPPEKREGFIKDLKKIGIYGNKEKDDFVRDFCVDILRKVVEARSKGSKAYYDEVCVELNKSLKDKQIIDFLYVEREKAKDKIIIDVNKDLENNSPSISEKLEILWTLGSDFQSDDLIPKLIDSIKKKIFSMHPKYPGQDIDWEDNSIDYYYYLAHLNPREWEKWANKKLGDDKGNLHPYIQAKYGEKIFAMKKIVRRISEIKDKNTSRLFLKDALSGIYIFRDKNYRFQMGNVIENYDLGSKLDWTIDKCMSWFEKLHELENKKKG